MTPDFLSRSKLPSGIPLRVPHNDVSLGPEQENQWHGSADWYTQGKGQYLQSVRKCSFITLSSWLLTTVLLVFPIEILKCSAVYYLKSIMQKLN